MLPPETLERLATDSEKRRREAMDRLYASPKMQEFIRRKVAEMKAICPECHGNGVIAIPLSKIGGADQSAVCPQCKGTGKR